MHLEAAVAGDGDVAVDRQVVPGSGADAGGGMPMSFRFTPLSAPPQIRHCEAPDPMFSHCMA
jgi:hypothetical protein